MLRYNTQYKNYFSIHKTSTSGWRFYLIYIYHRIIQLRERSQRIMRIFYKKHKRYETINETISKVLLLSPFRQYNLDINHLQTIIFVTFCEDIPPNCKLLKQTAKK